MATVVGDEVQHIEERGRVEERGGWHVGGVPQLEGHAAGDVRSGYSPFRQLQHLLRGVQTVDTQVGTGSLEGDHFDARPRTHDKHAARRGQVRVDKGGDHRKEGPVSGNDPPSQSLVALTVVAVEVECSLVQVPCLAL